MKRTIYLVIMAGLISLTAACSDTPGLQAAEKSVPVETMRVSEEIRQRKSSFIGTVQPGKTVRFSFKTGGRIADVYVEKGDRVKKGDIIASLEKTDLVYVENLAKAQLEMVKAQYEKAFNGATAEDIEQARLNVVKARDAYEYAEDRLLEVEQLYLSGTASKQAYDQTKLERNIRQSDLKLAEEIETQVKNGARYEEIKALSAQLASAETEYEYRKGLLADAVLKSDMDGVVMEVLAEKGEITGSGYPVMVIRSEEKMVYVGVPEKELPNITLETEVVIEKEDLKQASEIVRIAEIPDNITGLYNIELVADTMDTPFGASVTVSFSYGTRKAFFIPISAIQTGSADYVYTVSEGRAARKSVNIIAVDNYEAGVTGLNEGDSIIISGTGRISSGDLVTVKEGNHDQAY